MEETCHCGAQMRGSDHCPCCGCEQYETTCERVCAAPEASYEEHEEVCG